MERRAQCTSTSTIRPSWARYLWWCVNFVVNHAVEGTQAEQYKCENTPGTLHCVAPPQQPTVVSFDPTDWTGGRPCLPAAAHPPVELFSQRASGGVCSVEPLQTNTNRAQPLGFSFSSSSAAVWVLVPCPLFFNPRLSAKAILDFYFPKYQKSSLWSDLCPFWLIFLATWALTFFVPFSLVRPCVTFPTWVSAFLLTTHLQSIVRRNTSIFAFLLLFLLLLYHFRSCDKPSLLHSHISSISFRNRAERAPLTKRPPTERRTLPLRGGHSQPPDHNRLNTGCGQLPTPLWRTPYLIDWLCEIARTLARPQPLGFDSNVLMITQF